MTLRDTRKFMYKQMLALEVETVSIDEALSTKQYKELSAKALEL